MYIAQGRFKFPEKLVLHIPNIYFYNSHQQDGKNAIITTLAYTGNSITKVCDSETPNYRPQNEVLSKNSPTR